MQLLTDGNSLRQFRIIVRGVFVEGDGDVALTRQYWPLVIISIVPLFTCGLAVPAPNDLTRSGYHDA